jgi:hypothetical protein
MHVFARDDGLFDVESHLVDRKPFPFVRLASPEPVPAGQALHDLWIRLTVDADYVVRSVAAAADTTPYALCKQAEATLAVLVGEKVARGWSSVVKQRLRGAAGCTHLTEMLVTMGTTAFQGINGLRSEGERSAHAPGGERRIDSCFAYGREREVVKMLWPQHHRPPSGS